MRNKRPKCQGRRRKWHGNVLGTFACGRNATMVVTTYVGTSQTRYVCDDPECWTHVTHGYGATSKAL